MRLLLLGNAISLISACFMAVSGAVKSRKTMFVCQTLASLSLALSAVVLGAPSGAVSLVLSALRNLLVLKNRYTRAAMIGFCILSSAMALAVNTRGLLGLVPIIATLEYAVGIYYFTSLRATRIVLLINMLMWAVYFLLIWDLVSVVSHGATAAVCVRQLLRDRKAARSEE